MYIFSKPKGVIPIQFYPVWTQSPLEMIILFQATETISGRTCCLKRVFSGSAHECLFLVLWTPDCGRLTSSIVPVMVNTWASPTVNIDNRMRQLVNQLGSFFCILQEQPNNCGYFCCALKRNCLSNVMVLVRQEKLAERFCFQLRKLELELLVNRGAVANQVFTE